MASEFHDRRTWFSNFILINTIIIITKIGLQLQNTPKLIPELRNSDITGELNSELVSIQWSSDAMLVRLVDNVEDLFTKGRGKNKDFFSSGPHHKNRNQNWTVASERAQAHTRVVQFWHRRRAKLWTSFYTIIFRCNIGAIGGLHGRLIYERPRKRIRAF